MKRSKRLQLIRSVAAHEELQERKLMASQQASLSASVQRLEELRSYRAHYASEEQPLTGAGPQRWQDYHKFMRRLDQAVSEQEQIVRAGRLQREAHEKRWMGKRRQLESLSRAIDRYRAQEDLSEARREQRQQDAIAQQSRRSN